MAVVADKVIVEIDAKGAAAAIVAEVTAALATVGEPASILEHAQLRLRAVEIVGAADMATVAKVARFLIDGRYDG